MEEHSLDYSTCRKLRRNAITPAEIEAIERLDRFSGIDSDLAVAAGIAKRIGDHALAAIILAG